MRGLEYHRLRQKLTQAELAERAHLSRGKIIRMEGAEPAGSYADHQKVAMVLGVPIDELFVEYEWPQSRTKKVRIAEGENLYNAISHFRLERQLSFVDLGKVLFCSAGKAKAACAADESPEAHVEILARALGITPRGFLTIYREGEML